MAIKIIDSVGLREGEDAFVNRLFPLVNQRMHHDPFVLWDHFELQGGKGFPPHPHRGFEGVTYLLKGSMEHKDSLGNESTIFAGGIQRFTAGKGIVHSETPHASEFTEGIQLWVNLAHKHKQVAPSYQAISHERVPEEEHDWGSVRYVLGQQSAVNLLSEADVQDINLKPKASMQITTEQTGLLYVLAGEIELNGTVLRSKQAALFQQHDRLSLSSSQGARFIVAQGQAHQEPIIQRGPFVD